ncbi:hypothetical protein GGS21DRAFT_523009 [Xylaria nigripes]|nr:hypothetical protein GGS21DRAFT_523009 [Xylaria nigripes]
MPHHYLPPVHCYCSGDRFTPLCQLCIDEYHHPRSFRSNYSDTIHINVNWGSRSSNKVRVDEKKFMQDLSDASKENKNLLGRVEGLQNEVRALGGRANEAEKVCNGLRNKLSNMDAEIHGKDQALQQQSKKREEAERHAHELSQMVSDRNDEIVDLKRRNSHLRCIGRKCRHVRADSVELRLKDVWQCRCCFR